MKRTCFSGFLAALAVLPAAVGLPGCVGTGPMDPRVIARYQREMAARSPSRRTRDGQDLGLLRPAPQKGVKPLEVEEVKDADGKVVKHIIRLSLDQAVMRALANNPQIQVVSFNPAISRQEMTQAAADFDYIFFGAYSLDKTDERTNSILLAGRTDTRRWQAGFRQKTVTGAEWAVAWNHTRSWNNAGFSVFATEYEPTISFEITQPLLREGWLDYNLSRLRIARLDHKSSLAAFRQSVESTITDVYLTYWRVAQARREVEIQEKLLEKTAETYHRVMERYKAGLDATKVQTKQAESAVASRQAVLIRVRKDIHDTREALGLLLDDPQINVLGYYDIVPTTTMSDTPIHVDAADQLAAALRNSPMLAQARLAIQAAGIEVKVARNETLPKLDVKATTTLQSLAARPHTADRMLGSGDYAGYGIGLELEYPIGNRQRLAQLRLRRLQYRQVVASLQNTADQIAAAIRQRVREIHTSWEELQLQRVAVAAARVQLQALEDTEEIRGRLTPEFLELKLSAQESLADAERNELQALVDYNSAMVELRRETGTVLDLPRVKISFSGRE
jgi:outer membrane protein TolC